MSLIFYITDTIKHLKWLAHLNVVLQGCVRVIPKKWLTYSRISVQPFERRTSKIVFCSEHLNRMTRLLSLVVYKQRKVIFFARVKLKFFNSVFVYRKTTPKYESRRHRFWCLNTYNGFLWTGFQLRVVCCNKEGVFLS